jgi:ketosteroid isomerase-like protein
MTVFADALAGIQQLQARYIDSVWRRDVAAFGDCFTDDAEWRIAGRVLRGRTECTEFFAESMRRFDRVIMTMQYPVLHVENGRASGRTQVLEQQILKDRAPGFSIAVYYDRFIQQSDRWRFAWHHYQLYYLGPPDMSGRFFPVKDYGAPFAMPERDETTVSL